MDLVKLNTQSLFFLLSRLLNLINEKRRIDTRLSVVRCIVLGSWKHLDFHVMSNNFSWMSIWRMKIIKAEIALSVLTFT